MRSRAGSPPGSNASAGATPVSWVCPCTRPRNCCWKPGYEFRRIREPETVSPCTTSWSTGRRKRHASRSSRTVRSRNSISSARWSAGSSATSISARWRACCPACSRPSSTSASNAPPSCTWPTCTASSAFRHQARRPAHGHREAGLRRPVAHRAGGQGSDRHQGRAAHHAGQHRGPAAGLPAARQPHRHLADASARTRLREAAARPHDRARGQPGATAAAASSCAPTPKRPATRSSATTSPTCARPGTASANARCPSRRARSCTRT